MHTPAPPNAQTALVCSDAARLLPPPFTGRRRRAGFSLIEVTLAIAIVAFAFISLIGLLPAGMSVFNQTMDATNELRISAVLSSMIQASDYDKLQTDYGSDIYYFDVDGSALDSKEKPISDYEDQRIYSAKVVLDDQYVQPTRLKYLRKTEGMRVLILIGKYTKEVNAELQGISNATAVLTMLKQTDRTHKIKVFPMIITKMDSIQ